MKILNKIPERSKYAEYMKVLEPGKAIADLDYKTAHGLRWYLYKNKCKTTIRKQENGLYTVGLVFRH